MNTRRQANRETVASSGNHAHQPAAPPTKHTQLQRRGWSCGSHGTHTQRRRLRVPQNDASRKSHGVCNTSSAPHAPTEGVSCGRRTAHMGSNYGMRSWTTASTRMLAPRVQRCQVRPCRPGAVHTGTESAHAMRCACSRQVPCTEGGSATGSAQHSHMSAVCDAQAWAPRSLQTPCTGATAHRQRAHGTL
jgi:hypothetical protein